MIAGIDYSTHTVDVVLLDDDEDAAVWYRVRIDSHGKPDPFMAARRVRDALPSRGAWLDDPSVHTIGIERPFGHPATVSALIRVQGAILACLPFAVPVLELGATTWKKHLTGRGGANKPAVREAAMRYFAPTLLPNTFPQDAFDALGIAVAARAVYRNDEP